MPSFVDEHRSWFLVLGGLGALLSVASLLALPWVVGQLPADYFVGRKRPHWHKRSWGVLAVRNVVGTIVVLAGIAMLVLPGQGLLTILAGLVIMEFPGKRRLERALVSRPRVLGALNWLRRRAGVEALLPPPMTPRRSDPGLNSP